VSPADIKEFETVLRPLLAGVAMHALIPVMVPTPVGHAGGVATAAVTFADALLAELRKTAP
jgi:hypothetical protein